MQPTVNTLENIKSVDSFTYLTQDWLAMFLLANAEFELPQHLLFFLINVASQQSSWKMLHVAHQ